MVLDQLTMYGWDPEKMVLWLLELDSLRHSGLRRVRKSLL